MCFFSIAYWSSPTNWQGIATPRQSGIFKKFRSETIDGFVTISSKKSACAAGVR
jgi:hypothetical protein